MHDQLTTPPSDGQNKPTGGDDLAKAVTLTQVLALRARDNPDRVACVHLRDGVTPVAELTYGALFDAARAAAVMLRKRVSPGARVVLVFPNEPDFVPLFLGCILAGMVAVPIAPPRNASGLNRIDELAKASGAELGIVSSMLRGGFERLRGKGGSAVGDHDWVFADELEQGDPQEWEDPGSDADTLAVLQFTSGSTGKSKGVMVRHRNILHNARMFRSEIAPEHDIRLLTWLPFFHDWGLFGCFVYPFVDGGVSIYFDASDFLQRPLCWLEAATTHKATVICAPNFAFDLAVQALDQHGGDGLDLSSLVMAKFGAEPVRTATLDRFAEVTTALGFNRSALRPSYGLAESTLIVTGGGHELPPRNLILDRKALERGRAVPVDRDTVGARDVVACGRPLLDQRVQIVDTATRRPLAADGVGEIWISGPSVAGGYWNQPEVTADTFHARLEGDTQDRNWLRTGDLGFVEGGELFICGRLKDIIIKTGANYFAEDLELSFDTSHPDLRPGCGAAFGIDAGGAERLVLVQEINFGPRPDMVEVIGAIQRAVSRDHAVLADVIAILRPGTLEKTSSGKIRRRHTRAMFLADALDPIHEWKGWS